jgi:hypothetical protein
MNKTVIENYFSACLVVSFLIPTCMASQCGQKGIFSNKITNWYSDIANWFSNFTNTRLFPSILKKNIYCNVRR